MSFIGEFLHSIVSGTWLIFQLILIIVIFYFIYKIIFDGYPRFIVDLLSFSFYSKFNLDKFLKKNNLLIQNFTYLFKEQDKYYNSYIMYQLIYNSTSLSNSIERFKDDVVQYYGNQYNYDDMYFNAIKEYYIFYNVFTLPENQVNSYNINTGPNTTIVINNYDLYDRLIALYIKNGIIQPKNKDGSLKGNDQLFLEIYENYNNKPHELHIIHKSLENVATEIYNINQNIIENPVISYVIIPPITMVPVILNDLSNNNNEIQNMNIYNSSMYNSINNYTWYFIEYLYYLKNNNQYSTFVNNLPRYIFNPSDYDEELHEANLISYINSIPEKKQQSQMKIMNNYNENVAFYEYINKRPIFACIYYNKNIINKSDIYNKIMLAYKVLGEYNIQNSSNTFDMNTNKQRITNLQKNGSEFKQFINTINFLHLYLNVYRDDISLMYGQQILTDVKFLKELWTPFFNDLIQNRLGTYTKRLFSSKEMGSSFSEFQIYNKKLGKILNDMIKYVFRSFFISKPVSQPQEQSLTDPLPS